MRLENKVAFISGSTRGIGRSTAEMFAREGAKVAVTGRTVDRGEKVVAHGIGDSHVRGRRRASDGRTR